MDNIQLQAALSRDRAFVGRHTRYPDLTGKRLVEGGKRLRGVLAEGREGAPLVTIITVCWNSARTIEQTIRSVLNQTYDNIEYIVIDGNSTDGTLDILHKYEAEVDYYVSEPDDGLYHAMNKGLELARGAYVLILNSDDWYENDAVTLLVGAKSYSGCDFVGALARYVDEEKGKAETLRSMPFDDSAYFRMPLRHETMLVPAKLYDRVGGYNTDYAIIADRDLTARLFDLGATFYEVQRPVLNFRVTGVSNTNIEGLKLERDRLLSAQFPYLTPDELKALNNPSTTNPEDVAEIANSHLGQPKLVRACRALLHDLYFHGAKRWKSKAVDTIGKADPIGWPKVSVILPFYEAADTIRACLDSILAQTMTELEVICINDCAVDETQEIIDEYIKLDARIKCIKNSTNMGLGASRNVGIRKSQGRYIFHIDPDDTIPRDALKTLYDVAFANKSDMTKGAYRSSQGLHGKGGKPSVIEYTCGVEKAVVTNTSFSKSPGLLRTTEGHWSYLYDAVFAQSTLYPTDLKMGQDSVFLVNAVTKAKRVSLVPQVVYSYESNPNSAMNRFTVRKFMDALEWRIRAWHVLRDAGRATIGEHLLFRYWNPTFFQSLAGTLTPEEKSAFDEKLGLALRRAGYPGQNPPGNPEIAGYFRAALKDVARSAVGKAARDLPLRVATFTTQDHGGAGIGSMRRVEVLRRNGVDAHIYCAFQKTTHEHVHRVPYAKPLARGAEHDTARKAWREASVLTRVEHPGLKARELFSKAGSIVDFRDLGPVFDGADIVHLHWVSGMFDYDHTEELADRPVVWTLADMNAFTGGCHYSEGCEGYRDACRDCPLLGDGSDLAHKAWQKKRDAYARIKTLHVICPSQWLAERARQSSLFGDRPVHMIPNAFPVDRFTPTNKMVARWRLGLPLDKRLIVFGADSLNNRRKGGDILAQSVRHLREMGKAEGIEGVFFGAASLDLGIRGHNMGHLSDEVKLSLIYAAADVFAFPSREDNAPLTVVEAMLSGTPVVAFPVGNVPELIRHEDTGYIARYEDAGDFAEGLAWALRDAGSPEALRRGLRGHLRARAHNDPETAVARHLELYRRAIAAGS